MKRNIINRVVAVALAALAVGCSSDSDKGISGQYVGFLEQTDFCPVFEDGTPYQVKIGATGSVDYDRTYAVEVVDTESTAIEGVHYILPKSSFTIKANTQSATFDVVGLHENFEPTDSVGVHLRMIAPKDTVMPLNPESHDINLSFLKRCEFDINAFVGPYMITSTYLYTWGGKYSFNRLVYAEAEGETSLRFKDMYSDGDAFKSNYDVIVDLDTTDPMAPAMTVREGQAIANARKVMDGSSLGDGFIRINPQPASPMPSQFDMCQEFLVLYHTAYIENVGLLESLSMCIFEKITDEEAEIIIRDNLLE